MKRSSSFLGKFKSCDMNVTTWGFLVRVFLMYGFLSFYFPCFCVLRFLSIFCKQDVVMLFLLSVFELEYFILLYLKCNTDIFGCKSFIFLFVPPVQSSPPLSVPLFYTNYILLFCFPSNKLLCVLLLVTLEIWVWIFVLYELVLLESLGGSVVEHLPLAQVMVPGSWDRVLQRVPAGSLLLPLPVSLPLSLCLSWINK